MSGNMNRIKNRKLTNVDYDMDVISEPLEGEEIHDLPWIIQYLQRIEKEVFFTLLTEHILKICVIGILI